MIKMLYTIPAPDSVDRVFKIYGESVNAPQSQLAVRAKMEGVSLNAMVLTLIAKGLG
ncbi:MAG: hypothetical protein AB7C98_08740 [Acidithiobacillus sp.]